MAVPAAMLAGCYDYDAYEVVTNEPVNVELAYAFTSPNTGNLTRQASEVITSSETNPRRPQSMRFIPLINDMPDIIDASWVEPTLKPGAASNPTSLLYRTRFCELSPDVNGFLVYGNVGDLSPTTAIHPKMYNGSLIETFPETITTVNDVQEGISFNLDPIYKSTDYTENNGVPTGAKTLATSLTAIATTSDFHTSTDETIKGFFDKFTNEGKHIPGSAASVKKWIENFRTSISSHLNQSSILEAVNTEAGNQLSAIASSTYPRDINLPDGAAVLRWDKKVNRFEPQLNTTTIDNINSIARFAYPAPLYYFIASDIKTSEESVDFATLYSEVATDENKTAWTKVLENQKFNKTSVTTNTRAVALTRPVQFAVAQLKVKIKAYTDNLPDAATPTPNNIPATGENFPLKGIVVCDQRPVNYRFEPQEVEQGAVSDAKVLFIYDNQVKDGCYLTTQSEGVWAEGCNTMVLQSLKDENVHIILEFENNSNQSFTCLDGIVYPGTRFYMVGVVDASLYRTNDPNANSENNKQVFTKDYITTVNMTVSSLARAYNVPPNLLSPNLEIGVETTPEWEGATPTVIRLDN
jgi:hypothetical protein